MTGGLEGGMIREVMRRLLREEGLPELDELLRIKEAWSGVVGDDAAGFSKPYRLEKGRLYVGVASHARVQDLRFRAEEIRCSIERMLGLEIEDVVIRKLNLKQKVRD